MVWMLGYTERLSKVAAGFIRAEELPILHNSKNPASVLRSN